MKIHQKLEYLIAMCSEEFIKDCIFIREITSWMGENDFTEILQSFVQHVGNQKSR